MTSKPSGVESLIGNSIQVIYVRVVCSSSVQKDLKLSNKLTTVSTSVAPEKMQKMSGGTGTTSTLVQNSPEPITFRDTLAVQSFWENDMAVIRCEADGEPEPSLSWFVDGKHAENFPRYQQIGDGLLVSSVTMEDENRKFICRAAAVSEITSNIAIQNIRLNVLHQPKLKGPSKISAYGYLGGRVNLTCNVDSNPPANFTWFRNNTLFTGDDNMTVVYEKNNSTLYINFVNNTWPESYLCKAENERGSTTVEFNLRKIEKPEPPKRAKIHSATHNSFQLEIHGPPTKDEDIVGYRVQIMEKKEMEKGKLWEVAREVTLLKDHPYIINDLNPNTEYVVRVTTQNRAGTGEYTNEMKTKTLRSSASSNYRVSTAFLALLTLFCLYRRA
ncbi:hypothetical protein RUM43_009677 [Polyplax serrata]|uniref:Uncharacterized protein n=1 Tax=Polyplax serrata TaxID=468196 RepID=A0AAN8S9U6_POLSC